VNELLFSFSIIMNTALYIIHFQWKMYLYLIATGNIVHYSLSKTNISRKKIIRVYMMLYFYIIYLEPCIPIWICLKGWITSHHCCGAFAEDLLFSNDKNIAVFSLSLIMRKLYCTRTYTACSRSHNEDYEERTYLYEYWWIFWTFWDTAIYPAPAYRAILCQCL